MSICSGTKRANPLPATTNWPRQWRTEIARRKGKKGNYTYHWNYRFTYQTGRRVAAYGGTLEALIAINEERWNEYQKNSKRLARRRKQPVRA